MALLILVTVVLLPVLPAFLLFKALPSTAIVSGPLKGLNINLGGAFGGYFAVVVLVISTHNILFPVPVAPPRTFQVWQLHGRVTDQNQKAVELLEIEDFKLSPPSLIIQPGGKFQLTFSTAATPDGDGVDYPDLTISHKGFDPSSISLEPSKLRTLQQDGVVAEEKTRRIYLDHISITRQPTLPNYSANGKAPQPTNTGQLPAYSEASQSPLAQAPQGATQ